MKFTSADRELLRELMRLRPVSADVAAVNRVVDRMAEHLSGHRLHLAVEKLEDGRKVRGRLFRNRKRFRITVDRRDLFSPEKTVIIKKD